MEQKCCVYCMNVMDGDICASCGKDNSEYQAAPHHLQPGTVLNGKYLVGGVLGEGGFGITYMGRDINLNLCVAIKEYFPSGVVNRNNTSTDEITVNVGDAQTLYEKGRSSFLTEARTLARFSSEVSVVSVHDFFSANNTAYIVMEYLEGTDLKTYVSQNGAMTFAAAINMLAPIMTVLGKIHAQGLIHRDISPANIMILRSGTVKLLDFGAARDVSGTDDKSLSILLKPGYAPEEQYRTKGRQGSWTDVYALSATIYKMLTGVTPEDAMNRIFSDDLRKISELNPGVTPQQESVIMKGMAIQQADRYQTMPELLEACKSVLFPQQSYSPVFGNGAPAAKTDTRTSGWNEPVKAPAVSAGQTKEAVGQMGDKKPNILCFILSIVTGLIGLYLFLNTVSIAVSSEKEDMALIFSLISTVLLASASVMLGRFYFPRIDNKKRKPNIPCFIGSLVTALAAVLSLFLNTDESIDALGITLTLCILLITVFLGYFYYPRLEKKKRKKYITALGGVTAGVILVFVIVMVYQALNIVTIGDTKIKRSEKSVSISADIVNDNDLGKLKNLKNLETLSINACFLDDDDVVTIGELTQLKKLSLTANTDITDVSALKNMLSLEYLNISMTGTESISELDGLTKLKELNVSGTSIADMSVAAKYSALDTLYMDGLGNLDESTVAVPASLKTLYCASDNLTSVKFVEVCDKLTNLYASGNNLTDISPLAKYDLGIVNLSDNQITDISPAASADSLSASYNSISDISCLKNFNGGSLILNQNQISDISPLADKSRLNKLELSSNKISDISALGECFKINSLDLSFNSITDISALATVDELTTLALNNNQISDISPLARNEKYTQTNSALFLQNNKISDVTPLAKFKGVKNIHLDNNEITDISPLAGCTSAAYLWINFNSIDNIDALSAIPTLCHVEAVGNPISGIDKFSMRGSVDSTVFSSKILKMSYSEEIDWQAVKAFQETHGITQIWIYDIPERQKDDMMKLGFSTYFTTESLIDELEEALLDIDAPETEGEAAQTEGETNG